MKKHYINNDKFLYNVILSQGKGKMTQALNLDFILLISKVAEKKASEVDYYLLQDQKQDAMLNLLQNWKNFDYIKFNNPLAYFTELIKRSFANTWNINKGIKYFGHEKPEFVFFDKFNFNV